MGSIACKQSRKTVWQDLLLMRGENIAHIKVNKKRLYEMLAIKTTQIVNFYVIPRTKQFRHKHSGAYVSYMTSSDIYVT